MQRLLTAAGYNDRGCVVMQLKPSVTSPAAELDSTPAVRVGVSRTPTGVAMLGETAGSWAFDSGGCKCGGGDGFLPYNGSGFRVGDRVHAALASVDRQLPVGVTDRRRLRTRAISACVKELMVYSTSGSGDASTAYGPEDGIYLKAARPSEPSRRRSQGCAGPLCEEPDDEWAGTWPCR